MKITVEWNDLDVNARGEYLRGLVFNQKVVKSMYGGNNRLTGCYSTFETNPSFVDINPKEKEYKKVYDILDYDEGDIEFIKVYGVKNSEIIAMWYWDGDGSLAIFFEGDGCVYLNEDCKKDYTWEKKEIK